MEAKPKPRWKVVAWLIVSQLMALGTLLFWVLVAGLSVMAFDSGQSAQAWLFVGLVWAYPLVPLVLAIAAWIAFAFRKNTLAVVLSTLTFIPPVVLYVFIWAANTFYPLFS